MVGLIVGWLKEKAAHTSFGIPVKPQNNKNY